MTISNLHAAHARRLERQFPFAPALARRLDRERTYPAAAAAAHEKGGPRGARLGGHRPLAGGVVLGGAA